MTALVLVLLSGIAIAAIDHSGQESAGGARSRSTARTLYAADAGAQFALHRLSETPPDTTGFDLTLPNGTSVQSRTRSEIGPQELEGLGWGPPPDGFAIEVGSGYVSEIFLAEVTALALEGSLAEVQAKVSRLSAQ